MPKPTGYVREVFASENGFNPYAASAGIARWRTNEDIGFCFAMSCRWIKLAMQFGIEGSSSVMSAQELLHISIVQSGYLRLKRTFTGAKNYREREDLVYEQSGLQAVWQKDLSGLGEQLETNSQKIFFEIGVPDHSLGLCRDLTSGAVYYFDPNYGLCEYDQSGGAGMLKSIVSYGVEKEEGIIVTCVMSR